jgi:choline-glycine betaine transporter
MSGELQPKSESQEEWERRRLEIAKGHMAKCWNIKCGAEGSCLRVYMNPVVSLASAVILWGIIIAIALQPEHMNHWLNFLKTWVAEGWSWIYIISQDIWVLALIYIAIHPVYGKLKLGRDDEEPVFSDMTWFSLLFTCGVAVGMFYYVAEPMWHYKGWGGARFIGGTNGYSHPSEDATHGMMVTYYHWGLHGWIPYTTCGALLGLLAYRRGFPLSLRFGFYPLVGDRVYGIFGDIVDVLSIITTIMGVCTSLGLGTMSINMGMQRLSLGFYRGTNHNVPDEPKYENPTCAGTGNKYWKYVKECDQKWIPSPTLTNTKVLAYTRESYGVQANLNAQVCIIAVITVLASISVVTGLHRGIRDLSRCAFALSCFLLLFVLFAGDTVFQLNLTVQAIGYYIWYLPKIAFHTDAFELLGTKEMGRGGFAKQGSIGWMDTWTIFYWGWWISWGPFVGTFLAKISRGRTLRQFVLWTLFLPSLYGFIWFGCVGGEAVKQQTLAEGSGLCSVGWLNGGGSGSPATKHCNLADEEMNKTTGKCLTQPELVAAKIINPADEGNCGRRACSDATLRKGRCGKMLPTCDHYAASYSPKQKRALGMGYKPPCKLENNGEKHPTISGKCQEFAWTRWVQKNDECIEFTDWVSVPCGSGADPTALDPKSLACGTGKTNQVTQPYAPAWCQDRCKDKITFDMVDINNPNRIYNHFTKGSVMSTATKDIWADMNGEFGPDETLNMSDVWVLNKTTGIKQLVPPTCFVPAPASQVCMWNQLTEDVLFDLIGTMTNSRAFSDVVSIIALGSLVLYFITSSDSGSLVVDIIAANGEEEPPIPQRIFWSFTEGATAIALLYSGKNVLGPYGDPGQGGLRALQAASIVMGLPYTFVLFWYSQALVQVCREEAGELDPERPRFKSFLFTLLPGSEKVDVVQGWIMNIRNLILPGLSPAVQAGSRTWPMGGLTDGRFWQLILTLFFPLAVVALCISGFSDYGIFMMGCAIHCIWTGWLSLIRRQVRALWGIPRGDFLTDYICTALLWPLVLTQLEIQMKEDPYKKVDPPVEPVKETPEPAPVWVEPEPAPVEEKPPPPAIEEPEQVMVEV